MAKVAYNENDKNVIFGIERYTGSMNYPDTHHLIIKTNGELSYLPIRGWIFFDSEEKYRIYKMIRDKIDSL